VSLLKGVTCLGYRVNVEKRALSPFVVAKLFFRSVACLHLNEHLVSMSVHLVLRIISFSLWLQVTLFYFATQTSVFSDGCLLSVLGLRSVFCDLSVDKNVILKRVWQNTVWGCRLHLFRLGWGLVVASCENGKENSDSRKGWEFLDHRSKVLREILFRGVS